MSHSALRLVGTVRTLMQGYGFLTVPGGTDHFFHKSDLPPDVMFGELREGDAFSFFSSSKDRKGPRASDMQRA